MEFQERLEIAHQVMAAKGASGAATDSLSHILLRRLGFPVPPPCFSSFAVNLLLSGISFAIFYGGAMWLLPWHEERTISGTVVGSLLGGVGYGALNAALARRAKRKYGLPDWADLECPANIFD